MNVLTTVVLLDTESGDKFEISTPILEIRELNNEDTLLRTAEYVKQKHELENPGKTFLVVDILGGAS